MWGELIPTWTISCMGYDELAYACGVLSGRGFIKRGRNNCAGMRTSNKTLAVEFASALRSLRGWEVLVREKYAGGKRYFIVNAYGKDLVAVFGDIEFHPTRKTWLPPKPAYEDQGFRRNFLAGFFDATGFVYFNREKFLVSGSGYRYVRITSVNPEGLTEVKKLLFLEGVESNLRVSKGLACLTLRGYWRLKTFAERVRLRTDKLNRLLATLV